MRIFGAAPDHGPDPAIDDRWIAAIRRDFAGTPVAAMDVRVVDLGLEHPGDVEDLIPDPASWLDPREPDLHRRVLAYGGAVVALGSVEPGAPITPGDALEIASRLQDEVIEQRWRPWPEIVVDGRTVVLDPRLGTDGLPRWEGRGGVGCAFGELPSAPRAVGEMGSAPRTIE